MKVNYGHAERNTCLTHLPANDLAGRDGCRGLHRLAERSAAVRGMQVLLEDGQTVPFTAAAKEKVQAEVDTMAASALRCLAFAQKTSLPAFAGYDGDLHHPVSPSHKKTSESSLQEGAS